MCEKNIFHLFRYTQPVENYPYLLVLFSDPLGSKSPPEVYCAPVVIPPLSTVPPSDTGSLLTTTSPSEGNGGNERKCNSISPAASSEKATYLD